MSESEKKKSQVEIIFEGYDYDLKTLSELQVLETLVDIDASNADKRISPTRRQVLDGLVTAGLIHHEPPNLKFGTGESFRLTDKGFARLRELQQGYRQLTGHLHFDPIQIRDRELRPSESISLGGEQRDPDVTHAGGIVVSADQRRLWKKHLPHVTVSTMTNGEWLLTNTAWTGWVRVRTEGRTLYMSEGT